MCEYMHRRIDIILMCEALPPTLWKKNTRHQIMCAAGALCSRMFCEACDVDVSAQEDARLAKCVQLSVPVLTAGTDVVLYCCGCGRDLQCPWGDLQHACPGG